MSIKVAIIDNGVSSAVVSDLCFDINLTSELSSTSILSHGSICAAIIQKYSTVPLEIGAMKVITGAYGNVNSLVQAIEWCVDHNVKVINLSIGVIEPRDFDPLLKISKYAYDHSCIIVASSHNNNMYTLPAASNYTIGVKCDPKLTGGEYAINAIPNKGIEFVASSYHFVQIKENAFYTDVCNSFATPLVTAMVCKCIVDDCSISFDNALQKLRQQAAIGQTITPYIYTEPYDRSILIRLYRNHAVVNHRIYTYGNEIEALIAEPLTDIIALFSEESNNSSNLKYIAQLSFSYNKSIALANYNQLSEITHVKRLYMPTDIGLDAYHCDCPVSVPVVYYKADISVDVIKSIKKRMNFAGYNVLMLTTMIENFLDGFIYLNQSDMHSQVISAYASLYNSDAVFVASNIITPTDSFDCDIIISSYKTKLCTTEPLYLLFDGNIHNLHNQIMNALL